ncbi:MAG: hypothetical protein GY757_25105, partial [bacterium]|nr:hypothetical protein [bacterium]
MKKILLLLCVVLSLVFFQVNGFSANFSISEVGEYGIGRYRDVFVKGQYAYCATEESGLVILDISDSTSPQLVSTSEVRGVAQSIHVEGQLAYIASGAGGMQIFDVSNPASPSRLGYLYTNGYTGIVTVSGNYAYVGDHGNKTLHIVDISVPATPVGVASHLLSAQQLTISAIGINGNYAYIGTTYYGGGTIQIIDISNPNSPVKVGEYSAPIYDIAFAGDYAYIVSKEECIEILDISFPTAPSRVGSLDLTFTGSDFYGGGISVSGNYAYVAASVPYYISEWRTRVMVVDITDKAAPVLSGETVSYSQHCNGFYFDGRNVFVAGIEGLHIIGVSNPTEPTRVGAYKRPIPYELSVKGNYAYVVFDTNSLGVFDVSDPTNPTRIVMMDDLGGGRRVHVEGNYAYLSGSHLTVLDISNPVSPQVASIVQQEVSDVFVSGNYAYLISTGSQLQILDVSDPYAPVAMGACATNSNNKELFVHGNTAVVSHGTLGTSFFDVSDPSAPVNISEFGSLFSWGLAVANNTGYFPYENLEIYDLSDPVTLVKLGEYETAKLGADVFIEGNYVYIAALTFDYRPGPDVEIVDISNPTQPVSVGAYDFLERVDGDDIYVSNGYIYFLDEYNRRLVILEARESSVTPTVAVDRTRLRFAAVENEAQATGAQTVFISNSGGGTLDWTLAADKYWLSCSAYTGTGGGEVSIAVDSSGLSAGTYSGTIAVTVPGAGNSPQHIDVTLQVYAAGQTAPPFGNFSTPTEGSTVSSSIAVTGWALDDIGIAGIKIYREKDGSPLYIGDAIRVEGARPDVAESYNWYPNSNKAGWGYMLLTNSLPDGDGPLILQAVATDLEGNS